MARFVVLEGRDAGKSFPAAEGETILGSAAGCGIRLLDPEIAPQQVRMVMDHDDPVITNMDDKRFVFVNSQLVRSAPLRHGDQVKIGSTVLRFEAQTSQRPAVPRAAPTSDDQDDAPSAGPTFQATQRLYRSAEEVVSDRRQAATNAAERRLATLYRVSHAISQILDEEVLLDKLLELLFEVFQAEHGCVLLAEPGSKRIRPAASWARGQGRVDRPPPMSSTILKEVVQRQEAVICMDAGQDVRFSHGQSIANLRLRSVMAVPLVAEGKLLGIIQLDSSLRSGAFQEADLDLLNGIALPAAMALERGRLLQAQQEKQAMERELENAEEVQRFLLPKRLPSFPGLDFGVSYALSEGLGGDYYDFVQIDRFRWALVVADVSGHSLSSALVMTMCRSLIRSMCLTTERPADLLQRANEQVERDTPGRMFVTVFLAYLDTRDLSLVYSNGGHNPPLVFRAGGEVQELAEGGMPVGMMPDSTYEQKKIQLKPGDVLVLYTDGLVEAQSPERELLGDERFRELLRGHLDQPPQAMADAIYHDVVEDYAAGRLEDDVTLTIMRVDAAYRGATFSVAGCRDELPVALAQMRDFARKAGFVGQDASRLEAVLTALLENAMVHGCGDDPFRPLDVQMACDRQRIYMLVAEDGPGFDHRKARRQAERPEADPSRGLPLIYASVDRVVHLGRGNETAIYFTRETFA